MKAISFGILKPEETHTFAIRLLPIIQPLTGTEPLLSALYPRLQERVNDLSLALGLSRSSKFTAQLNDADEKRDRLFLGFKNWVTAFIFHPDPALSQEC